MIFIRLRSPMCLTSTESSFSITSTPISSSFAEIDSRCFGMTFVMSRCPCVAAAAHIYVPASIISGMMA